MNTTAEQGKAMDSINEIVSSIKFNSSTAKIFAYSPDYIPWIANKVIIDCVEYYDVTEIL